MEAPLNLIFIALLLAGTWHPEAAVRHLKDGGAPSPKPEPAPAPKPPPTPAPMPIPSPFPPPKLPPAPVPMAFGPLGPRA